MPVLKGAPAAIAAHTGGRTRPSIRCAAKPAPLTRPILAAAVSRLAGTGGGAGAQDGPFFVGRSAGGFVRSLVPSAAWLNPHLTTGYAVEVSKFFNIQP
jgi:hypothetical protein